MVVTILTLTLKSPFKVSAFVTVVTTFTLIFIWREREREREREKERKRYNSLMLKMLISWVNVKSVKFIVSVSLK